MKKKKQWKSRIAFLMAFIVMFMSVTAEVDTLQAAEQSIKSVSLKMGSRSVTKKTVTLHCGDKRTIKVAVLPKSAKKKVVFASNKKNVVNVSNKGVITAKAEGTAKIKVTVTGKNKKKKSTYVNIKVKNVSLSLNKKKASLQVGKSLMLKAKVTPKKKVKWNSSNTKVATVSSKGLVKAKKEGTAKITARVGKEKASCVVTVKKKKEKGIYFKNSSLKIAKEGDYELDSLLKLEGVPVQEMSGDNRSVNYYFNYVQYPELKNIKFTSSNENVVRVSQWDLYNSNLYNYNNCERVCLNIEGAGVAVISAKLNGKTAKCEITVTDPKIDKEEVTKIIGGSQKLSVQGTTSKVTWKSENEAIAKVDSAGNVTAVGIGTTKIDAIVDRKILRCSFTTEIVPQFLNTYQMKDLRKVVLSDTVLRTSQPKKLDVITDENGQKVTDYNWETVGDITTVDFSKGNVYPVFDLENQQEDWSGYRKTEIYLVGSSQNAVIRRLDTTIGGGKDTYWEYTPGEEMGTITIYSRDSSPALYSVTIDGHELIFATACREYNVTKPTDKDVYSSETRDYIRANAASFDVDISGAMASVAKYIVDKIIETTINALINKFFPW